MRRLFIVIGVIGSIFLANCGDGGDSTSPGPSTPYPAEFSALYEELSTNLSMRENELRTNWDGVHAPVIYAATLLSASCNNGSKLFDPSFRAGNSLILGHLAGLGVQGIVLQINYPILTTNFTTNALAYLTAFKEIADEIRALGLKIIVEHNVLLPGYASLDPTTYYSTLDKTQFGIENYLEILDIIDEVNPDYLSIVTEPGTFDSNLQIGMSVVDWKAYVNGVVSGLSTDRPGSTTKLGAGSGAWENSEYVIAFADISGLDYIDIHSYPVSNGITDYLKVLDTWPAMVRAINPALEIISSESWLYKAKASELGGAPTDPAFFARDTYSFWGPLDSQFFDVLAITAHKNNYTVIAPFWSIYFSAYLDYNDPSLSGLTPTEILDRAYAAAYQAIQNGQTTDLGDHYSALIVGIGP